DMPFLKALMPCATSPISSEILPRPNSSSTTAITTIQCQILSEPIEPSSARAAPAPPHRLDRTYARRGVKTSDPRRGVKAFKSLEFQGKPSRAEANSLSASSRDASHQSVHARLRRAMASEPGIHNPCADDVTLRRMDSGFGPSGHPGMTVESAGLFLDALGRRCQAKVEVAGFQRILVVAQGRIVGRHR